jgi:serine/threonine protein kinase
MSLENLLVHESGALIIDMGMCLRVPVEIPVVLDTNTTSDHPPATASLEPWTTSFGNMNLAHADNGINGNSQYAHHSTSGSLPHSALPNNSAATLPSPNGGPLTLPTTVSARRLRRFLVTPQGTCGKWIYMSPEIYKNATPFDGFAVDMWAAGVILFLMVTGFPPWDRACNTDERFRYMSAGYLVQMLTEWDLGLSPDVMDLLQRMLFLDPKDRLSLDQVRAHPWMVNGPCDPPTPAATASRPAI